MSNNNFDDVMDLGSITDDPFQKQYEAKMAEYEAKIKAMKAEKAASNIACCLIGGAAVGLVSSAAMKKQEKKYKKQLNNSWEEGYNTGRAITTYAAENYISGLNDGLKRIEAK